MKDRIFIKPAPLEIEGQSVPRRVRKPTGPYLDQAGEWVNPETYWLRRINDKDVVEVDPPAEALVEAPADLVVSVTADPPAKATAATQKAGK